MADSASWVCFYRALGAFNDVLAEAALVLKSTAYCYFPPLPHSETVNEIVPLAERVRVGASNSHCRAC